MAVLWVVAPCSLVEVYQRLRGPCPDDGGTIFMKYKSSLPCLWKPTNGLCRELAELSPHPDTLFLTDQFSYFLHTTLRYLY
jgi:hypothetical protein